MTMVFTINLFILWRCWNLIRYRWNWWVQPWNYQFFCLRFPQVL